MPNPTTPNPVFLSKFVLWIVTIVVATLLLRRHKVTARVRLVLLVGGTLLFGIVYGFAAQGDTNPNPVFSIRNVLTAILVKHQLTPLIAGMLAILLLTVFVSNKSICGWGCQLGLLQDLLHRVPLPKQRPESIEKWKPPFWLSNSVRIVAFMALVGGLAVAGRDWIKPVDPFGPFNWQFTLGMLGLFGGVVVASLFVYRPWCQFLCPFGLAGWLVEQVSLLRPRINRDVCKECRLCVKACPTQAMADFYADKKIHADCFACGACIAACPHNEALEWKR